MTTFNNWSELNDHFGGDVQKRVILNTKFGIPVNPAKLKIRRKVPEPTFMYNGYVIALHSRGILIQSISSPAIDAEISKAMLEYLDIDSLGQTLYHAGIDHNLVEQRGLKLIYLDGNNRTYLVTRDIYYHVEVDGVTISPYVEGCDDFEPLELEFPFTMQEFRDEVQEAEELSAEEYDDKWGTDY